MIDQNDFVVMSPRFYYVDYNGNNRQEVDIWYEDGGLRLLSTYPYDINASLNNKYSNVSDGDINNTSHFYHQDYYSGSKSLSDYQNWYLQDDTKVAKKMGTASLIALDYEQRLYVGDYTGLPSGVSSEDALKGVQEYLGAYFIPNTAKALPIGDNDLNNELKNGYVIVSFDMYTIDNFNRNVTDYHLAYSSSHANMFNIENFDTTQNGFSLVANDVAFYDLNKASTDDYSLKGIY